MDDSAEKVPMMTHPPDGPTDDPLAAFTPSEEWRQALTAAPRSAFVPDRVWTLEDGLIDRQRAPQDWHAVLQRDDALLTQIDDGATELTAENVRRTLNRSSSCSAPNMVFDFLGLLEPYAGDRVLEIGTGTGWTAGLLCAYLGADRVTSVEVDEQVAAQAKENLHRAGFTPRLIVGDGAQGAPEGAPYDRVHVTAGVREIPYAWVEQTRPGGIIVLPWTPYRSGGYKVRLVCTGTQAVGRFHGDAGFMLLRSQRPTYPSIGHERESFTPRVDPRRIARSGPGLEVALRALLPGLVVQDVRDSTEADRISVWDPASQSYVLAIHGQPAKRVGSREVWAELESAYLRWLSWGEPGIEQFGLTVNTTGQHLWLDSPNNQITEATH